MRRAGKAAQALSTDSPQLQEENIMHSTEEHTGVPYDYATFDERDVMDENDAAAYERLLGYEPRPGVKRGGAR